MAGEKAIINFLKHHLEQERICHTKGVVKTAVELAKREGISVEKTRIAALLHDAAKYLTEKELRERIRNTDWNIDETEKILTPVLHAPVGADIAKEIFNVTDYEILEAIRYHTIGHPRMGKLALIIFAADMIEPNRVFPGVEQLRMKAENDLYTLVISVCDHCLKYNLNYKRIIHPNTLFLRNRYLRGKLDAENN